MPVRGKSVQKFTTWYMHSGSAEKYVTQHLHVVNEESWSGVGDVCRARVVGKYIGLDT